MKIEGYQVIDIKISELPLIGKAYLTAIIEVKGCRFSAAVEILPAPGEDIFSNARQRAIIAALNESEKSDHQIFGWRGGKGGGFGGKGGQGRRDPNQKATEGQVKRLFAIGKENGFDFAQVRKAITDKGLKADDLTVGQVDEFIAKMEQNSKAKQAKGVPAHA